MASDDERQYHDHADIVHFWGEGLNPPLISECRRCGSTWRYSSTAIRLGPCIPQQPSTAEAEVSRLQALLAERDAEVARLVAAGRALEKVVLLTRETDGIVPTGHIFRLDEALHEWRGAIVALAARGGES